MRDMIAKILEMDEHARKITEEVRSDIEKSEEEIKKYKEKIKTEYIDRARKRIEKNRINEQAVSDKELQEIRRVHELGLDLINERYEQEFANWVNEIVDHVVGE